MRPHNGPGPGGPRAQVSQATGPPWQQGGSAAGRADPTRRLWAVFGPRMQRLYRTPCPQAGLPRAPGQGCSVCAVPGPLLPRTPLECMVHSMGCKSAWVCMLRVDVRQRGPRQAAWYAGASQSGKQEPRLLSVLGHGPSPSQPRTLFPETGEIGGAWTCTGRGVFTLFVGRQADEDTRSWTRCMGVGVAVLKV